MHKGAALKVSGVSPVAGLLEAAQKLVKEDHLAGGDDQAIDGFAVVGAAEVALGALKQEGMVAALLQLCDDVQEADLAAPLGALHHIPPA